MCISGINQDHPTSAYPLVKKVFHPLDEIRADTKVRPYNNSLTLALSRGERGSGDLFPWPIRLNSSQTCLKKKYALVG